MLEGLPRYLMADPSLVKIIHILFIELHHNEKIRDYMQNEYGERADDYTEAVFRKQMEEGRIRPCDPKALAKVFNAVRFAWLYQTFILDYSTPLEIAVMEKDLQVPIGFFDNLLKS